VANQVSKQLNRCVLSSHYGQTNEEVRQETSSELQKSEEAELGVWILSCKVVEHHCADSVREKLEAKCICPE
jgi:hypothetical protein